VQDASVERARDVHLPGAAAEPEVAAEAGERLARLDHDWPVVTAAGWLSVVAVPVPADVVESVVLVLALAVDAALFVASSGSFPDAIWT
jgi:hypothetical protein